MGIFSNEETATDENGNLVHKECLEVSQAKDVCPACRGSGSVYSTSSYKGDLISEGYETCYMCNGTGDSD